MTAYNGMHAPNTNMGLLCDRMQNLEMSGSSAKDARVFHFCYICNTQLNSCKQAVLHCSGKRHKKKLQFLQTRKNPVGASPGNANVHQGSLLPAPMFHATNNFCPPPPAAVPVLLPPPPPSFPGLHSSPSTLVPVPQQPTVFPASANSSFYPVHNALQPAVAGTAEWYSHQQTIHYNPSMPIPIPIPPPPNIMGSATQNYYEPMFATGPDRSFCLPGTSSSSMLATAMLGIGCSSNSNASSPALFTDVSVSCGSAPSLFSGERRSIVMSPSESSSISSEPVNRRGYRCSVCQRLFLSFMQLQNHQQIAKHFRQAVTYVEAKTDTPSDAEMKTTTVTVYRHKLRSSMLRKKQSRSSSTSSDQQEIIVDSGYTSASGDDIICVTQPTAERPTAKFQCKLCNTFLNSPAQTEQHIKSLKHRAKVSFMSDQKLVEVNRNCNGHQIVPSEHRLQRRRTLGSYRKRHQNANSGRLSPKSYLHCSSI